MLAQTASIHLKTHSFTPTLQEVVRLQLTVQLNTFLLRFGQHAIPLLTIHSQTMELTLKIPFITMTIRCDSDTVGRLCHAG